MVALIFFVFVFYNLFMIALCVGWRKAVSTDTPSSKDTLDGLITVVVAVRNEENTISDLLNDLSHQTHQTFEVIVVDDQSDDDTRIIVEAFAQKDHRFFLHQSSGTGKKRALTEGILKSKGSIIVTTDADCRVSEYWLDCLSQYFTDELVRMVFGGVRLKTSTFFSHLQSVEFMSLIGSGAAMASLGSPIMCNGANLAFRKDTFNAVGGYEGNFHIPSGDDEFLMRKILEKHRHGVRFASDRRCVVTTLASTDLKAFLHQRIRWAGKWKMNTSLSTKMLAIFVLCFQLCVLALPVFIIANLMDPSVAALLWFSKVGVEFVFIHSVTKFFNASWRWSPFLLLQFIYPVYVVLVGICSNFRPFQWKGRKLKSLMVSRY